MSKVKDTTLRAIDKPHYSYLQAFYYSFFSSLLYVDVGKRWRGLSLGYLVIVFLITTLPFSARAIKEFNDYFNNQVLQPLNDLPPFAIQDGQASFDGPMPYLVKNKAGDVVAIIDTTGQVTQIENERYPYLLLLITKEQLFFRNTTPELFHVEGLQTNSMQTEKFDDYTDQVFNGKEWVESSHLKRLKWFVLAIIYPTVFLSFLFVYMVFLFTIALMAQLIAQLVFKFSLTYLQSFRLLMVAATPQIVLLGLFIALNWLFSGMGLGLFALVAFYFCFAVLSLKQASNKLVTF